MSNFLAIATVTATLSQIVYDTVTVDVGGATTKTMRPNAPANELPNPGVNLFLYHVTPNAAWSNADLPTRRDNGDLAQRPRVALDLDYLLTFYGDDSQLEPQRLLGSTVKALHAEPVLSRKKIRSVITAAGNTNPPNYLLTSNLDEEIELVKFAPLALSLEELSKLWSVFIQTAYTLSVAYRGTVVLIESDVKPRPSLPVRERKVYVTPFRQLTIDRVESANGPAEPIVSTSAVIVFGHQLRSDTTEVRVGDAQLTPTPEDISDSQIIVPLPAGLRAGVVGVQVVQPVMMGTPLAAHNGVESNVSPFVLHPTITVDPAANIADDVINGIAVRSADVTVNFTPEVRRGQRVVLSLNELLPLAPPGQAYNFNAPAWSDIPLPPGADAIGTITFRASAVIPGSYLVRAQVDGAESLLYLDAGGQYNLPQVTI